MAEKKELTGIERELVLQYLKDDNVPLTVTLLDKPVKNEVEIVDDRMESPQDEDRIPLSAVFPVAVGADQMSVYDAGIILLKNTSRSFEFFLGHEVCVQFYFNHIGLYFVTMMKKSSRGPAIVVPSRIFRIPDVVRNVDYDFYGSVSYNAKNSRIDMNCLPLAGYRIFCKPKWSDVLPANQVEAKKLLEEFIGKIKSDKSRSLGNGLHLLSVVRFLTEKESAVFESIEGRTKPFNIIYADTDRIVLSGGEGNLLSEGEEYSLSLTFVQPTGKLFKRVVELECRMEGVYEDGGDACRKCYSLRYSNLKNEDYRFLYERMTGKLLEA